MADAGRVDSVQVYLTQAKSKCSTTSLKISVIGSLRSYSTSLKSTRSPNRLDQKLLDLTSAAFLLMTYHAFLSIFECEFELGVNRKVVDLRISFLKHIFNVQSEHRGLRYDFSKKVSPYFQLSNSATPLTLVLLPLRLVPTP